MPALPQTITLLLAAIIVAILARRLRLPYTVGLVIAGAGIAALHADFGIPLTQGFIYTIALPPLLFEAALAVPWPALRRDALPVLTLALLGTLVSAAVVTGGMLVVLGWPLPASVTFGVLIAATDPVAVVALFKDTGVGGRLRLLVDTESLLNDGVAAVLFALVLVWLGGTSMTPTAMLADAAWIAGGGLCVGLGCGALALLVAGHAPDRMVETAVTLAAAYGSFLLAEQWHMSGVLATVAAGLLLGNTGPLTKADRAFVVEFWEFAAFVANSLVFTLIGVALSRLRFGGLGWWPLAAAILIVLVGRALTVYPLCLGFRWSRWAVPMREQHVLWWGGLRGALGLALALSIPETLTLHDEIVQATFGVVAFSVVAQGATMPALLRMLGVR